MRNREYAKNYQMWLERWKLEDVEKYYTERIDEIKRNKKNSMIFIAISYVLLLFVGRESSYDYQTLASMASVLIMNMAAYVYGASCVSLEAESMAFDIDYSTPVGEGKAYMSATCCHSRKFGNTFSGSMR